MKHIFSTFNFTRTKHILASACLLLSITAMGQTSDSTSTGPGNGNRPFPKGKETPKPRPRRQWTPPMGLITNPGAHDPVMMKEDSTFYLFYTGMNVGQMTSTDLVHWRFQPSVFSETPQWAIEKVKGYRGHTWAPDIVKHDGKFHMFYSCSTFGKNTSAIGHAWRSTLAIPSRNENWEIDSTTITASNTEPWHDTGMVVASERSSKYNCIDPSVIVDEKGTPWMFFGSFWGGIQLIKLTPDMECQDESFPIKIVASRRSGKKATVKTETPQTDANGQPALGHEEGVEAGDNAIEAPFIFKHGKWYYLFVSWDYCCRGLRSNYKVVVGRSKNVCGPFLDRDGKDLATGGGTLVWGGNDAFIAGGHNAAYTFDGKDYFLCHGYDRERGESKLFLTEMQWDKKGWPIVK